MDDGANTLAVSFNELNFVRPDFIVYTGDIVAMDISVNAWKNFHKILNWLEVPSYFLPGNHDWGSTGGE